MRSQFIILCTFILLLSSVLRAEEVELAYARSSSMPSTFFGLSPSKGGSGSWEKGADRLTDKAKTYDFFLPRSSMKMRGEGNMIIALDNQSKAGDALDTVFIDLNRNHSIDEGERFDLKPVTLPSFGLGDMYKVFRAETIPLLEGKGEGDKPYCLDLYCLKASTSEEGPDMIFGISASECLRGRVTIDGVTYNVILIDHALNGSFDDFEKEGSWEQDTLSLTPEGAETSMDPYSDMNPLRRKMILGGKAFEVRVVDGDKRLNLNPIEVEYGDVGAADTDIQLTLFQGEWGTQTVKAGEKRSLPAGTWAVKDFMRMKKETGELCTFRGSEDMKVEIASGGTKTVVCETRLNPRISNSGKGDEIRMSLVMKTAQGASFSGYYGGKSDKGRLDGIPFLIKNGSGEVILEGKFTFG